MQKKMFLDASKQVFENAYTLRHSMTEPEKILWNYLKQKPQGYKFRRQHAISKYIADFYCHSLKLIIEVDGGVHNRKEVSENDKVRQCFLESEGIRFLRFKNEDVLQKIEEVISEIEMFLKIPLSP